MRGRPAWVPPDPWARAVRLSVAMSRLLAVISSCAALSACDRSGCGGATRTFAAAAVLDIDLPPATAATQWSESSRFTLDPGARSPRVIEIARLGRAAWPMELGYSEMGGGSGGNEYELHGAVRVRSAVFEVTCRAQSEHEVADMEWCKDAVASLRCRGRDR